MVEVDGELRPMVFLTNNVTWSAQTIADLYRCRWSIEVFLQGTQTNSSNWPTFWGTANAPSSGRSGSLCWRMSLLRFCAYLGRWPHSFTRLLRLDPFGPLAKLRTAQPAPKSMGQPVVAGDFWEPRNKHGWPASADPVGQPPPPCLKILNRFSIFNLAFQIIPRKIAPDSIAIGWQ